jgi:hypothetical protein
MRSHLSQHLHLFDALGVSVYILVRYFEGYAEEENVAVSHDKAKLEALIKQKQEQAKLREKLHEEYMAECKLLQVSIPDVKPPKTIKELGKEAP